MLQMVHSSVTPKRRELGGLFSAVWVVIVVVEEKRICMMKSQGIRRLVVRVSLKVMRAMLET